MSKEKEYREERAPASRDADGAVAPFVQRNVPTLQLVRSDREQDAWVYDPYEGPARLAPALMVPPEHEESVSVLADDVGALVKANFWVGEHPKLLGVVVLRFMSSGLDLGQFRECMRQAGRTSRSPRDFCAALLAAIGERGQVA